MEFEDRIPRKVALALRAMTQAEEVDPTPAAIPEGYGEPLSLEARLRLFVRQELSQAAQASGMGTFEEESELDFEEDDELISPYQVRDMADEYLREETGPEEGPGSEAGVSAHSPPAPAEPEAAVEQPPTEPAQQASSG